MGEVVSVVVHLDQSWVKHVIPQKELIFYFLSLTCDHAGV